MWANHLCRTGAAWVGPDSGARTWPTPHRRSSQPRCCSTGRVRRNRNRELVAAAALIEQAVDDVLQNPATRPAIWRESVRPTRSHNGKKSS